MLQLVYYFFEIVEPVLVPICFVFAWVLVVVFSWTIIMATRDTIAKAKQMHEIPCTKCQFFTNDRHLKCTVQPKIANTEQAIECSDYRQIKNPFASF
ncbi:hypothetical protein [Oscillatoria salina]|uniref:hypothetical protein n=1 Tax=Oscillatoria salina TaxID=331517 RepID=UPI0013B5C134|nr:hypothetical protein [Oscillatoria salina]MBZ8183170.1 hypothetical protein [Oscillatoria salina IIICB1]NET90659.1 hypothetical protein [Kamptonema sp. SIO1D9]